METLKHLLLFLILIMLTPSFTKASQKQLEVFPLIFIPKDNTDLSGSKVDKALQILSKHLLIAQNHYKELLHTDTFKITSKAFKTYHAKYNHNYYTVQRGVKKSDSAHKILNELFDVYDDNRMDSNCIYLVLYARPNNASIKSSILGGGRTFNGMPNSGGGYVEMELSSLLNDKPYAFQSTLVHELGHAFGLTHVDCFSYDMSKNTSLMSYNPLHISKGEKQSDTKGDLNAQEYYILSQNRRAFPHFVYKPDIFNLEKLDFIDIEDCYLGPMNDTIGKIGHLTNVGYELFFNGRLVSGAEATFYTLKQAKRNCLWNQKNQRNIDIACHYNGKVISKLLK